MAAGVRIRVHDLRRSHVSLLLELGFSPIAVAERMGHESVISELAAKYEYSIQRTRSFLIKAGTEFRKRGPKKS